nr:MAG TPA: hypothetical protein [Caudoviricetes sp.]
MGLTVLPKNLLYIPTFLEQNTYVKFYTKFFSRVTRYINR